MKKESKYIEVISFPSNDGYISSSKTRKEWESKGIDKTEETRRVQYFLWEPEKLTEVDMTLIIRNKP